MHATPLEYYPLKQSLCLFIYQCNPESEEEPCTQKEIHKLMFSLWVSEEWNNLSWSNGYSTIFNDAMPPAGNVHNYSCIYEKTIEEHFPSLFYIALAVFRENIVPTLSVFYNKIKNYDFLDQKNPFIFPAKWQIMYPYLYWEI